ncbi:MAG: hypothetical protein LBJ61_06995 [Deltaproteobacteria bacterium]|jgi:hypothetical protein|nr:hypothetical protein [Deltaproteobacteria bacterium]
MYIKKTIHSAPKDKDLDQGASQIEGPNEDGQSQAAASFPVYEFISEIRIRGQNRITKRLALGPEFVFDPNLWPALCDRVETILNGQKLLFPPSPYLEETAQDIAAAILEKEKLIDSGQSPPEPTDDLLFKDLRASDKSSEGLPYGLARMGLDGLRESASLQPIDDFLALSDDGYCRAVLLALILARLEHPANLNETKRWLNESSGIPFLLGLEPEGDWERLIDPIVDYAFAHANDFFPDGRSRYKLAKDEIGPRLFFAHDPTRFFFDSEDESVHSSTVPIASPRKGRKKAAPKDRPEDSILTPLEDMPILVGVDIHGYVNWVTTPMPTLDGQIKGREETLETFTNYYLLLDVDLNSPVLFLGPWDDPKKLKFFSRYDSEAAVFHIQKAALPKNIGLEYPAPGQLLAHKLGKKGEVFLWGCPGYGPILEDWHLGDGTPECPKSIKAKRFMPFTVTQYGNSSRFSPQERFSLIQRALVTNARFRQFALPEYPLGLANAPNEGPYSVHGQTVLGLLAYQAYNYIRNVFKDRQRPFCWQRLKRLFADQTVAWAERPEQPPAPRFGPPNSRAKQLLKVFDIPASPLAVPITDPASLNEMDSIILNIRDYERYKIMERHAPPGAVAPTVEAMDLEFEDEPESPKPPPPRLKFRLVRNGFICDAAPKPHRGGQKPSPQPQAVSLLSNLRPTPLAEPKPSAKESAKPVAKAPAKPAAKPDRPAAKAPAKPAAKQPERIIRLGELIRPRNKPPK